jgi:hypothetical protein
VDVAELAHLLNDHDIGYDKLTKKLIFACEGLAVPEGAALPPPAAMPGADDPTDLTMAFKLHSRPGAARILLLDFTGYTATGTAWNSMTNGSAIVTPAYDIDGDATTFSDQERANIIAIWRAVAEDYAAWNVDVTTEETDAAGAPLVLTSKGSRAVIGGSSLDWYGQKSGGVAYVNTFASAYYEPAYIFPAQLANGAPKYVAEATSHGEGGFVWGGCWGAAQVLRCVAAAAARAAGGSSSKPAAVCMLLLRASGRPNAAQTKHPKQPCSPPPSPQTHPKPTPRAWPPPGPEPRRRRHQRLLRGPRQLGAHHGQLLRQARLPVVQGRVRRRHPAAGRHCHHQHQAHAPHRRQRQHQHHRHAPVCGPRGHQPRPPHQHHVRQH